MTHLRAKTALLAWLVLLGPAWLHASGDLIPGASQAGSAPSTCELLDTAGVTLDQLFRQMDRDGSGFLSAQELAAFIDQKADLPSDLDGNGQLSRQEFRASFARVRYTSVDAGTDKVARGLLEADKRMSRGELTQAIELLQALVPELPGLPFPLVSLGQAYRRAGRLEEARVQLERVVRRIPGVSVAWLELAIVDDLQGQDSQCEANLRQALAYLRREFVGLTSGATMSANSQYLYAETHLLGAACHFLGRGKPQVALELLQVGAELLGPASPLATMLAQLRFQTSGPAGAQASPVKR